MEETVQFGYHVTLDAYGCPQDTVSSFEILTDLLAGLALKLDMLMLTPPYIVKAPGNLDRGGKDPGGLTGFVIIAESHISIHTFPKRGFVSMDIYSCKKFSFEDAIDFVKKSLKTEDLEIHTIDRGTRYPIRNIY
jgi:S-adenosylmethionine decarboxylase